MNKANPFLAPTALFPLILLSKLFITLEAPCEAILLTISGKTLAKGTTIFVSGSLPNDLSNLPKYHQEIYLIELF